MAAMARRSMSSVLSRALNPSSPSILPSRLPAAASAVKRLRRVASPLTSSPIRRKSSSGAAYYPIMDSSSNWSNPPRKETILLDGCDYEHWLIVIKFPENPKPSEEEMVAAYVDTLTAVVGSEEEAKKKIYSVCTTTYTGFGALISQELSYRVERLPGVRWVLPDAYLDAPNKDYGGLKVRKEEREIFSLMVKSFIGHDIDLQVDINIQGYARRHETVQVERREPMQRGMSPPVGQDVLPKVFNNPQQDFQSSQETVS
ncbi:hypothetical protein KFK09_010940 [Dendrobium nobile]|uniref:MORF/ORRM1/DAG-like MORF domain-containing protein n=1 Tax=Dendrobium nobile TaxID=94219 RepID=A0A8T3BBB1_DENNO|nr:hypothetical protein KFK09_010940 [Dendrobium nobile]